MTRFSFTLSVKSVENSNRTDRPFPAYFKTGQVGHTSCVLILPQALRVRKRTLLSIIFYSQNYSASSGTYKQRNIIYIEDK